MCSNMCLIGQNGERVNVAVKTCKDCSPDVMEKFMSEAGTQRKRFLKQLLRSPQLCQQVTDRVVLISCDVCVCQ